MHWIFLKAWRACGLAGGLLLSAAACQAGCGVNAYASERFVLYFDCDSANAPRINVIVLDDKMPLKVVGRTPFSNPRGIDSFAVNGDELIVLTWDQVEVFSLQDPAHPLHIADFRLKHQGSTPGYPRIEKIAEDKFLLLASVGVGQLGRAGDAAGWELKDLPPSPEFRKKMEGWPLEHRFSYAGDDPVLVKETGDFRYELIWKFVNRPGESISRQYLRKLDKTSGRKVSELFLGERVETID